MTNLNQIISQNQIRYLLNIEEKTASVVGNTLSSSHITIPRSIKFKSEDYIVTSICENAFKGCDTIQSISFPKNSEIKKFEKNAFFNSTIESIMIPSSLIELEDGWCYLMEDLKRITVDPANKNFTIYGNKFLLQKSSPENEFFDILSLSIRNIEFAMIPYFIRIIAPYAFSDCTRIELIPITKDSELEIIGKCSFFSSSITEFTIPPKVTKICEQAFYWCDELVNIMIPQDSNLQIIEKDAFSCSAIKNISIPSNLVKLEDGWCHNTEHLTSFDIDPMNKNYKNYNDLFILGKSSPENENFDILVFANRNISVAKVPDFIKVIGQYSFQECNCLKSIEFSKESQIETIERGAFYDSSLEQLFIPSKLKCFKQEWCNKYLIQIDIDPNNKNFIILDEKFLLGKSNPDVNCYDVLLFACRDIVVAQIPSFIKIIGSNAFDGCCLLTSVEIPENSELQIIESNAFHQTNINKIFIPRHLKKIGNSAFVVNKKLKRIEFAENSEIDVIDENAFINTNIEYIEIPRSLKKLNNDAFNCCMHLKRVDFQQNSQIQTIGGNAFALTSIESFIIPSNVSMIGNHAFGRCADLKIIEIEENTNLNNMNFNMFGESGAHLIIMIPIKLRNNEFFNFY